MSGSTCLDNYGQYILPGKRFQPIAGDQCTQCVCINGKPENCLTITCQPPENCKKSAILQKKGNCCEYICLNPDEEEDMEKANKLAASANREYSEGTNMIDHLTLNDLEASLQAGNAPNGAKNRQQSSVGGRSGEPQQLSNASSEPIRARLFLRSDSKPNSTNTPADKRYSNLESTLKKLIANKNTKNQQEDAKNSTITKFSDDRYEDQRPINPAFQNLGIGVGIGNGNADSAEVSSNGQANGQANGQSANKQQNKQQRVNYITNYQQTIYSPPSNKYSPSPLGNEPIRHAGRKYGIYGGTVYHNNLGNGLTGYAGNQNSSQFPDDNQFLTLNELMRTRPFNRNYIHHTAGGNLNLANSNSPNFWFSAQNLGLRLIASTVCTFLILGLLFFLIHRLRQRRLMVMIRRLQNRRESNGQHANGLPCFANGDLLNRANCFVEGPPPYFWKPPYCNTGYGGSNAPNEPPPPYDYPSYHDGINGHQTPSFSNPLLNINPTDHSGSGESTANQLTCFNSTTSNLLGNGNCFNSIEHGQTVNANYDVPFSSQTTSLKTNPVRTSQPAVQFDFMNNGSANLGTLPSQSKLIKHKKSQLDKLRASLAGGAQQMVPTSTRANNELAETQNLANSIIEDQMFNNSSTLIKDSSVCRLFINNQGIHTNRPLPESGGGGDTANIYQNVATKYQPASQTNSHSQSVDNLTANKSISGQLLDFYNNNHHLNSSNCGSAKDKTRPYSSNLSLRANKYQRCVVNIPNAPQVFKSALLNQSDTNIHSDNLNDDTDSIQSPPPPAPPERKVSLPVELRNEEHAYQMNGQPIGNQFFFNESKDFEQKKCLSFNHSTPTINNLNQFRYSRLYLNKLKQEEYQKQLEQNKLEQQLSQSSTNESLSKSLSKSLVGSMSASSLKSIEDQYLKEIAANGESSGIAMSSSPKNEPVNSALDDDELRPSTSASSNTTRIMINFKK